MRWEVARALGSGRGGAACSPLLLLALCSGHHKLRPLGRQKLHLFPKKIPFLASEAVLFSSSSFPCMGPQHRAAGGTPPPWTENCERLRLNTSSFASDGLQLQFLQTNPAFKANKVSLINLTTLLVPHGGPRSPAQHRCRSRCASAASLLSALAFR